MKYIIIASALFISLTACNDNAGFLGTSENNPAKDSIASGVWSSSERDMTITAQNSWSDLFLDSTALENYIQTQNITENTAKALRGFYNRRNFGYAWLTTGGITEQGRGLWHRSDTTVHEKGGSFKKAMDTLLMEDTINIIAGDTAFVQTELELTKKFVELWNKELRNNSLVSDPMVYIPAKKEDPLKMAEMVLAQKDDSTGIADTALVSNPQTQYNLLKRQLKKYVSLVKDTAVFF